MRYLLLFSLLFLLPACASLSGKHAATLVITQETGASTPILVFPDAPVTVHYAAEEMQKYLAEISGVKLPIETVSENIPDHFILLGANTAPQKSSLGVGIDALGLGPNGYIIQDLHGGLWIAGATPRGTLYGVYGLLEDHLGCRWFTPEVSVIPKQDKLVLGPLDERIVPELEYREPFTMDCFDGDWAARNRMNGNAARLEEKHGGKVSYYGFVHTFDALLPPDKYFDTHPEYFSLIDGARRKDQTQLCCTNENVIRLVTEEVRRLMREHPESTVFSVSQNDRHNFCQCDKCTALAEVEGTQMAPVLLLVNSVAKAVAAEFPDKAIDTLAYQYTRKAPKTMRPEPNVIIRLCSIECCFAHSFTACDSEENKKFVEDVIAWGKICNRLWVWDYVTSFRQYFVPFPNLRVRDDNIRFLEENHVTGIFEQDVYTTMNGEFSGLSGYLNAKLLWNSEYGEDRAINEFLDAVYGPAAKPLRAYLDLIHDKVQNENIHFDIWIDGSAPFLTEDLLLRADALFEEAEAAVAQDAAVLERVKVARLSVDYAMIEFERRKGLALYERVADGYQLKPDFSGRVSRFFEIGARNGVTALWEGSETIETYKAELDQLAAGQNFPPRSACKVESVAPGLAFSCYEGSWNELPDFTALQPLETGVAPAVSTTVTAKTELFGLRFTGYFHAPKDGLYMFHLMSNDGSRMYLGGDLFINNDGLHRPYARTGTVSLGAGYHPITIEYFESSGGEVLELQVQGPELAPQAVPEALLAH